MSTHLLIMLALNTESFLSCTSIVLIAFLGSAWMGFGSKRLVMFELKSKQLLQLPA